MSVWKIARSVGWTVPRFARQLRVSLLRIGRRDTAALLAATLVAVGGGQALAQTTTLPSMTVMTAPLVAPSTTFYGTSTTHTNSLAGIGGFSTAYPPEIVETARALKNDPDLIYEFVHNQIEAEYAFGLRKGPLGALIDKSGTPFDQNALFVELVRQAGYTAQYEIGQVTMTEAEFVAWTGVSDVQAACKLLAAGGIPATFNGSGSWPSNCSTTGSFTSVTMLHIWSQVKIGGTWYAYDPSIKSYTTSAGVNLTSKSGYASGEAATAAATGSSTGTQSGLTYIKNASETALDSDLQTRGSQLLSDLKSNEASWDTDAVVGITKISPEYKPANGWRNATPYQYSGVGTATTIAGDIPDQYRSTLRVTVAAHLSTAGNTNILDHTFYVDEIDGRRLGMTSNFVNDGNSNDIVDAYPTQSSTPITVYYYLMLDDTAVKTYSCNSTAPVNYPCPLGTNGSVTLVATHPYAANNGAYGQAPAITSTLDTLAVPFAVVSGWGSVSPALLAKWSAEKSSDTPLPLSQSPLYPEADGSLVAEEYEQPSGDFTQQRTAASWLAQVTRMLQIQARIGNAVGDHQHSIGVINWHATFDLFQNPPTQSNGIIPPGQEVSYTIADEFTELNIDSAISITSKSNNAAQTNAVIRSVALSAATLEGSVLEQMEDLPDTASTASRFAWGDQPNDEDPCFKTTNPRPFFDFTGSTASSRAPLYTYEGSANGCGSAAPPVIVLQPNWTGVLEGAISGYLSEGSAQVTVHVTAPAETFLGPGARFGATQAPDCIEDFHCVPTGNWPSYQRGGALVATLFDSSGNVLQVAHALTGQDGVQKGGGGKEPARFSAYDPAKAADILKDRFVDRSVALGVDLKTGSAGFTTPTLLSVGGKSAPYGLDATLSFKAASTGCTPFGPCTGPVQGGWNHNWDIRFTTTGSGLEALGATSPQAAAGTLVAFVAMQDLFTTGSSNLTQDVYSALVADWWRQQMVANVATVNQGFSGKQYVRLVDGTWLAPIGDPGVLTMTGSRVKTRDHCFTVTTGAYPYSTARRWDFSGVSFSLRNAGGDVLSVAPWTWKYELGNKCAGSTSSIAFTKS